MLLAIGCLIEQACVPVLGPPTVQYLPLNPTLRVSDQKYPFLIIRLHASINLCLTCLKSECSLLRNSFYSVRSRLGFTMGTLIVLLRFLIQYSHPEPEHVRHVWVPAGVQRLVETPLFIALYGQRLEEPDFQCAGLT